MPQERPVRILYAEDDPALARLLQRRLKRFGYEIDLAENGTQGLEMWQEGSYDLLALDHDMPGMTGLEVIRALAAKGPLPATIIITGAGAEDVAVEAMKLGADDYLVKDPETHYVELLPSRIRQALARKKLLRDKLRAENALREKTRAFEEKVRELNCLYEISKLAEKRPTTLEEVFEGVLSLIPPAVRQPGIIGARIVLKDREYRTPNFKNAECRHAADLVVRDEVLGRLEVCYLEGRPQGDEELFPEEEKDLINAIAENLGRIIQRYLDEEALRESEERLNLVLAGSGQGFWDWDLETGFVKRNERWAEILGFTLKEVESSTAKWMELVHPDDRGAAWQSIMDHLEGRSPEHKMEYRMRAKNGKWKWISDRSRVVKRDDNGRPVRMAGIQMDISDGKKAEELLLQAAKFRAVADLSSGVAHNFNNLLQVVIGNANLALMNLQMGDFSDMTESLEQIIENCNFGAEVVRRLNSFAKMTKEGDAIKHEIFDLSEVARQAAQMTRAWWKTNPEKNGVKVRLHLDLEDGCLVKGQKSQLFELLINLIKNAAEAVGEGGDIEVSTTVQEDQVVLTVRDTGVGIPENDIHRVFTPFYTSKLDAGTGLGLATSRTIVDSHAGEILVDSVEGEGSVFTVNLPFAQDVAEGAPVPEEPLEGRQLTILAVDDMEPMLKMLKGCLEKYRHTVITARSGVEAIRKYRETPVDLVICDLGMPGLSGWQVGKRIKAYCEERGVPKPPFIILTGWTDQPRKQDRIEGSGVDAVVEKPVDVVKLLGIISRLVDEPE
ncbi:response regulator [Thermodesulfobacteriota bacterium]